MIQGFIFDLDGTMVDNMMVHHRAWQRMLLTLGVDLTIEEVQRNIHGINDDILLRLFGDRFSPAERKRIAFEKELEYRELIKPQLKLIKGLENFLFTAEKLNIPMGIGTAAPPENVQFTLDTLGLRELFGAVIDASMVTKGKPHPEVFLTVADRLSLKPEECLVFEDAPTGAEAAERSGMSAVIITTTHSASEFTRFNNIVKIISDFAVITPEDLLEISNNGSR